MLVPPFGPVPGGHDFRPTTAAGAARALWLRAALRLPLLALVVFYLAHGVDPGRRSPRFPDGAGFVWALYNVPEIDAVGWVVGGILLQLARIEVPEVAWSVWPAGYAALTAAYAVLGLLVWRRDPRIRRYHRGVVRFLTVEAVWRVLSLFVVVPGAVWVLDAGANAGRDDWLGEDLVALYELFLLPWALTLTGVTIAVVVRLRSPSTRDDLGTAQRPPGDRGPLR